MPKRSASVISRQLGDEYVVLNTRTDLAYCLTGRMAEAWRLTEPGSSALADWSDFELELTELAGMGLVVQGKGISRRALLVGGGAGTVLVVAGGIEMLAVPTAASATSYCGFSNDTPGEYTGAQSITLQPGQQITFTLVGGGGGGGYSSVAALASGGAGGAGASISGTIKNTGTAAVTLTIWIAAGGAAGAPTGGGKGGSGFTSGGDSKSSGFGGGGGGSSAILVGSTPLVVAAGGGGGGEGVGTLSATNVVTQGVGGNGGTANSIAGGNGQNGQTTAGAGTGGLSGGNGGTGGTGASAGKPQAGGSGGNGGGGSVPGGATPKPDGGGGGGGYQLGGGGGGGGDGLFGAGGGGGAGESYVATSAGSIEVITFTQGSVTTGDGAGGAANSPGGPGYISVAC